MINMLVLWGAYLSGSIPFGLIITKVILGIDIRQTGSGNIGSTNVYRSGSRLAATLTLISDIFKGFLPIALAKYYGVNHLTLFAAGYLAVLGHVFPLWLGFKGGKGVATSLGVYWALSWPLGCLTTILWIISTKVFKISSLSALLAFILTPCLYLFINSDLALFSFGMAIIIVLTHRDNIRRLWRGTEEKFMKGDAPCT